MTTTGVLPEYVERLREWADSRHAPEITVCIPTRDRLDVLVPCLLSLARTTLHWPVDLLLGDSGSSPETLAFYESCGLSYLTVPGPFNYSRSCNALAAAARGRYLLFLNNDTQAVTPDWVPDLLQEDCRGVVGALLAYPKTGRLQHAGVEAVRANALAEALEFYQWAEMSPDELPVMIRHIGVGTPLAELGTLDTRHSFAVTGAFHFTPKETYTRVGGLDEAYETDLQDIDYCLKVRKEGLPVVLARDVLFTHVQAATRAHYAFPRNDWRLCLDRWQDELEALAIDVTTGGTP